MAFYHTIIERATTQPKAVALDLNGQTVSYAQYVHRASWLAKRLQQQQVSAEDRVLVFCDPDDTIPYAILSIMMVGAVYVPLDPTFPSKRIKAIVEDVKPSFIITHSAFRDRLPKGGSTYICCVDEIDLDSDVGKFEPALMQAENAAYIFYTSGTTGAPKGVVLTYKNLEYYLQSALDVYKFNENDRHLSVAKFTFSISLFDLLLPFVSGGTLILRQREQLMSPVTLVSCMESASCFHMGPALLEVLVKHAKRDGKRFSHIRHVSSGGDLVPVDLLSNCRQVFPNAELWVIYGCTEVACMGLTWQVPPTGQLTCTYVGKPFEKAEALLLTESGSQVEDGEVGEVYFSGDGLAREYLNRPELTKEKFVLLNGRRHYATGDLGIKDVQHGIRLLGRKDFQVQINGVRIETQEVEFWLKQTEGVVSAHVVAAQNTQGQNKMVAFVVPSSEFALSEAVLHQSIAEELPEYMLPARIFFLEKLPLNINQKLDRAALQILAKEKLEQVASSSHYADERQALVAKYWIDCGASGHLDASTNFFESGGDSLGAAELAYGLSSEFNVALGINDIYTHPTLSGMTALISRIQAGDIGVSAANLVVPLGEGDGPGQPFFLIPGLGGHVATFGDFSQFFSSKWRALGLIYPAYIEEDYDSLEEVATRMLQDIKRKQAHGPYFLSGYSMGGLVALEIARQLIEKGEQARVILIEVRLFELAPLKPLLFRLPIYAEGKIKTWMSRWYNKRKQQLYNCLVNVNEGDQQEKAFPPLVRAAFESGRKQMSNYRVSPCNVQGVLIKCTESAWWDHLRNWLEDYGWSRYIKLASIAHAPGDHLDIVRATKNHAKLAEAIELSMNNLTGKQSSEPLSKLVGSTVS